MPPASDQAQPLPRAVYVLLLLFFIMGYLTHALVAQQAVYSRADETQRNAGRKGDVRSVDVG
jgi:hypothetical protein